MLRDYDCCLGIECIGPATSRARRRYAFIHTLDGRCGLAGAVGTGNIGVLLDAWRLYTSGGEATDRDRLGAQDVVAVRVNDAPAGVVGERATIFHARGIARPRRRRAC